MALLDRILSGLTEAPRRLPVSADAEPGIYAWWSKPEASGMPIPEYPGCPRCRGLVSPLLRHRTKLAKERGLLSTRIDGDHSHGSIGNSTFRQTLAALLRARLQLEPFCGMPLAEIAETIQVQARRACKTISMDRRTSGHTTLTT